MDSYGKVKEAFVFKSTDPSVMRKQKATPQNLDINPNNSSSEFRGFEVLFVGIAIFSFAVVIAVSWLG